MTDIRRTASELELFTDLSFVVAVSIATANLVDALSAGEYAAAAAAFATSFFAIWWAWMNFTWHASAFDDASRTFLGLTMVQMLGVVVMSIGIGHSQSGFGAAQVLGYCIMRCALIAMWLRVLRRDDRHRAAAGRYALGIGMMQLYWIALLAASVPLGRRATFIGFVAGVVGELLVPRLAERTGRTPWHPHHIADRYGCFVMIVLGEAVLGVTRALASAIDELGWGGGLAAAAPVSLALVLVVWRAYFRTSYGELLTQRPDLCWRWGYLHSFIFAALALLGCALVLAARSIVDSHAVSWTLTLTTLTISLTLFFVTRSLLSPTFARTSCSTRSS